jgi:hydroxyacylglutathione hydrolase
MQQAMDKLARLPEDTLVYCGHEYTVDNCRFARAVEPDNADLQRREADARRLREAGERTLPSRLGEELKVNPFLRTREPSVVEAANNQGAEATPGVGTMAAIRAWKDRF